ncbi:enoyl-CoA hydratase/isomerase family protein [Henriciella mobilis]|uniref:Enoyl-CoA hydratase n=1 Tax=Henriciella mobilis TaxID=2305467 RepID=A0A399RRH6_9PROT|nr:enoyl-CoA hydratase-related protein [Henriciella mobilis]RIJ32507.1 enoyl-CoA hydratase [Henriciella mobilis]
MSYEQIRVEKQNSVCVITLNRPEKLNAWTPYMSRELGQAITAANEDDDIGAIVMTGEGRGFCAGADMGYFQNNIDASDNKAHKRDGGIDWISLIRSSKPCIAAVNGPAFGIGVTQILPFDMIVASRDAKFGFVFVKVGIVPELASSHYLMQRVGWGTAHELMLTARPVSGEEAVRIKLADRLAEPDTLLADAVELATQIAENPSPMLRMTKELLTANACETDHRKMQQREHEKLELCYTLPEHKEAVSAFIEKRKPNFKAARHKAQARID